MRISDWSSDVCSSDLPGQLLCLACQVRRHGGRGRQAAEGARVGEQPPQAPTGRGSPGHRGTEGRLRGKTLAPQRKREAVRRLLELTTLARKSVGEGKRWSVRVDPGGRRYITKKKHLY